MHKLLKQHAETFDLKELKKLLEKTSYKKDSEKSRSKIDEIWVRLKYVSKSITGGYTQIGYVYCEKICLAFIVKDGVLYYNFGIIEQVKWWQDIHYKIENIKPAATVQDIENMSDIEKAAYIVTIINILENKD